MEENSNSSIGIRSPYVIDVSAEARPPDLDSYLNDLDADSRSSASSFVFRITPQLNSLLGAKEGSTARAELLRRVSSSGIPLQTLTLEADTIKLYRISEQGLAMEPIAEIAAVQQADLRHLVEQHQDVCYYHSNPKHHYVAPSTQHCTAFFRLGDVIRSRDALDRLAFWLRPYISTCDAILVDTWSIAALVIRALQLQQRDIPFDCLASHPQQDRRGEAEALVKRLVGAMRRGGHLTCIVSVTSSGRYGQIIAEMCGRLEVENVKTIAIYKLADVPNTVEALCQLSLKPTNYPPDDCPLCKQDNSTPIILHPGLYYLKEFPEKALVLKSDYFLTAKQNPPQNPSTCFSRPEVLIKKALSRFLPKKPTARKPITYDSSTFTARYRAVKDLFSVHRDDRHKRHHSFHIDVGKLLDQVLFGEKFDAKLKNLKFKPDVIITTSDDVSVQLGERASERLGCRRVTVDSFRHLEKLTAQERTLVQGARRFLIVDDVLVSGSRLSLLNTELRERTEPPAAVSFLVGLGRPASARLWKNYETALTSRVPWEASLDAVEQIFLPNWDEKQCPWCRESEFLQKIARPLPETPDWLKSRLSRLAERGRGLRDEPLWLLTGVSAPRLGHGSVVGPAGMSAIATAFSIAAALQRLRTDEPKPLNPHYPDFNVFDGKNLTLYSEGLLRATILRVVQPKEWGLKVLDELIIKELLSAAQQPNQAVMLGELLLAVARGSLDQSFATLLRPLLDTSYPDVYRLISSGLNQL